MARNLILKRAKRARKNPTKTEEIIWNWLRNKGFHGLKFKRQVPYGSYYLDFYCESKYLVIEIDGSQHAEEKQELHDQQRTKYLESCGLRVIRIWNDEVLQNPEGIYQFLEKEVLGI